MGLPIQRLDCLRSPALGVDPLCWQEFDDPRLLSASWVHPKSEPSLDDAAYNGYHHRGMIGLTMLVTLRLPRWRNRAWSDLDDGSFLSIGGSPFSEG